MIIKLFKIIVISCMLLLATTAAADLMVKIDSPDPITGNIVRLGDIATIAGDDKSLVGKVSQLELERAPLPGRKRLLKSVYVAMKIKSLLPDMYPLTVDAPEFIEIRAQGQVVKGEDLERKAREYFYSSNCWDSTMARIRALKTPRDEYLPPGKIDYEYNILSKQSWGRMVCRIDLYQNNQKIRSVPITFEVKRFGEVCVAAEDLRIGDSIRKGDIIIEHLELRPQDIREEVITSLEDVNGKEVRRYIKRGTVITEKCLANPNAVNRNEEVTIVAQFGSVKVSGRGLARESGAIGEVIQVEYQKTRKRITGKVIGQGTVSLRR